MRPEGCVCVCVCVCVLFLGGGDLRHLFSTVLSRSTFYLNSKCTDFFFYFLFFSKAPSRVTSI